MNDDENGVQTLEDRQKTVIIQRAQKLCLYALEVLEAELRNEEFELHTVLDLAKLAERLDRIAC